VRNLQHSGLLLCYLHAAAAAAVDAGVVCHIQLLM
jgi:hypothetical protein